MNKVINISSACIYGQTNGIVSENDEQTPNWDYGVSKLAAERYATIYNTYKKLTVTSLRYGIVYGEREWFRRVLPIFVKRFLNGEAPVVFGHGEQVRDFIHVSDVVALHNKVLLTSCADGEILNVGTGIGTTMNELAEAVCKIKLSNLVPMYEEINEGEFSKFVDGKKRNTHELGTMLLAVDKAKMLLGWEPKVSLEQGLQKTYLWAKNNPKRWTKIFSTRW